MHQKLYTAPMRIFVRNSVFSSQWVIQYLRITTVFGIKLVEKQFYFIAGFVTPSNMIGKTSTSYINTLNFKKSKHILTITIKHDKMALWEDNTSDLCAVC